MTSSKPITVHEDGAVTLRLSPLMWRHLSSGLTTAVAGCGPEKQGMLSDLTGSWQAAEEHRKLEEIDGDIAADAALMLVGVAILAYVELGQFMADGLTFSRLGERVDGLSALGLEVFKLSEADLAADLRTSDYYTPDRLKAAFVNEVAS